MFFLIIEEVEAMITKQLDCEARAGEEAEHKTTPSRSLVSEQKSPVLALTSQNCPYIYQGICSMVF